MISPIIGLRTLFIMELEYDIPGWGALNSFFEEPFLKRKGSNFTFFLKMNF
jgi:hypothetical protein